MICGSVCVSVELRGVKNYYDSRVTIWNSRSLERRGTVLIVTLVTCASLLFAYPSVCASLTAEVVITIIRLQSRL